MRLIKLILISALILVSALFGYTKVSGVLAGETEGPEIHCDQQVLEISVQDGEEVLLAGVTASDPQDGDLTDRIILGGVSQLITGDTATVTYVVFDSHDNMAQAVRTVRYTDYSKPTVRVTRPLIFTNENISGISGMIRAEDVIDGDISDRIRLSNLWITEYTNVYSLTVLVTNSMGDTTRVELPVIIQDEVTARPVIKLRSQLVYVEQGGVISPEDYLISVTANGKHYSLDEVQMEHQIDTSVPGTYWVHFNCSIGGVQGTAVMTVVVR